MGKIVCSSKCSAVQYRFLAHHFSESENKWVIGTDNANLSQQLILEQTDSAIQASPSHTSLTHLSSNAWNMCMIDTILHGNITTRSWTKSPN